MKPLPVIQNPAQPARTDATAPQTAGMIADPEKTAALKPRIVEVLSTIFDPEIPVNIYDLGLVYDIMVDESNVVAVRMTLTAPACPAAQFLPSEVKNKIARIAGVTGVAVDIVWDPPWDRERMSDAAKLQLGMF